MGCFVFQLSALNIYSNYMLYCKMCIVEHITAISLLQKHVSPYNQSVKFILLRALSFGLQAKVCAREPSIV